MSDFELHDDVYNQLLNLLNNQHKVEVAGKELDLDFLADDLWLQDTAVIENVVMKDGLWEIQLVFVHYQNPHKLVKRIITRHYDKSTAQLTAQYMRRLAAKDQRGTLSVCIADFNICYS